MRLLPTRLGAVSVVALSVSGVAAVATPAAAAWESDYGTRAAVTFGENVHAQMPVSLDLPAPASGGAITSVQMKWQEQVPQVTPASGSSVALHQVSRPLDVSGCTAGATCHVDGVLPTALIPNGTPSITFNVANGEGLVSFFNRAVSVQNPKPVVTFTSPEPDVAVWGDVNIAADASPSAQAGAAPFAGVRFYLDGNLSPDADYMFDATAPYSVTLPATDIAPVLSSRTIVVVAQDTDGNLSQMPTAGSTTAMRRLVHVGPPPVVRWDNPPGKHTAAGSVSQGVMMDFYANLPDTAPAHPGQLSDPYISSVETLLDGTSVSKDSYTEPTTWNGLRGGTKLRSAHGYVKLTKDTGLTSGRHQLTLRVTTSYGSVADTTTGILVSDGVTWTGPVTSGGRAVRNGFVVTAGTTPRFQVPVSTNVAGTRLVWADMQIGSQSLLTPYAWCPSADPYNCPEAAVLHSDAWAVPDVPGTHTLEITASADADGADTITRTIVVQPAARLSLDVSSHLVRAGRSVGLTGRLTRRDTGRAQAGRTVDVQWLRSNGRRWQTVATRTTDAYGMVSLRLRPAADGYFRLRSAEVRGTLGPGLSPDQKVFLRR